MKNILRFLKRIIPLLALAVMVMAPNWGWGQESVIYTTGFESTEGFTASTIYNNTEIKYAGEVGKQWGTYYGTASTTEPISGSQSMQMRWYSKAPSYLGYTFTNFDLANVTSVSFKAANTSSVNVIVSYSTDGGNAFINPQTYTLSTTTDTYTYSVSATGEFPSVRIKFQMTNATVDKSRLYIDDVAVSGITSAPTITVDPTILTGFTYIEDSGPSAEQTFTVSGSNLTADISIAATTNYEISKTSGSGYTTPLTFAQSGGTVAEQTVYVRLKAGLNAGDYNGEEITASSTGADNKTVTCSGSVTAPPDPEPTNHVTSFSATTNSSGQITVSWIDATGAQLPAAYLVKAVIDPATPTAPVNGTPEADEALVKNIAHDGTQKAIFTGLDASTIYNFAIWSYTNSGATIAYKTDPAAPQVQATTESISITDVIITEVYGGGGNSGATLKNDFIELFNTTSSSIDIGGWSIQYYSATGDGTTTNTFVIPEGKSIPVKSYFLIEAAAGSGGTEDLPLPDASCDINLSGTDGKVILYTTNVSQSITSDITSITGNTYFKDYIPYGTTAVPVWGSAMTSKTTNTTSATRKTVEGSYVYTQNIGNDFEVIAPTPQNSGIAYFRSKIAGNWGDISTWESSSDNTAWIDAVLLPLMKDNVVIDHAVTLAVDGTADCYNLTINGSGSLNIASDASRTGSLIARGAVSGNTNVQHYISGNPEAWHLLSSPVAVQEISGDFTPTGTYDDGSGYDFYGWDEPSEFWMNRKDSGFSEWNDGTNFNVGQGYMVAYQASNPTKTFIGTLNTGNYLSTLTVSGTQSYKHTNLLGNPYPSSIDWKSTTGLDKSNLVEEIGGGHNMYIWNEAHDNYGVYNDASNVDNGTNGVTRYIAPMQGFFVVAANNGSFGFENDARVHSTQAWLKSGDINNAFRLSVTAPANAGKDEILLDFGHEASQGGADKWYSMSATAPALYVPTAERDYSIRFLTNITDNKLVPVAFKAGLDGEYSIQANFNTAAFSSVKLIDQVADAVHDLNSNSTYTFTATTGDDANRFKLTFGSVGITNPEATDGFHVYAHDGMLYLETQSKEAAQFKVYNLSGQLVMQGRTGGNALSTFNVSALGTGVYVVNIILNQGAVSQKLVIQK